MEQIKPLKLLSQTHQENPGKKLKMATYKHIRYISRDRKRSPLGWDEKQATQSKQVLLFQSTDPEQSISSWMIEFILIEEVYVGEKMEVKNV